MAGTGRFAPSPTGPLHLGSLVAAVGSYLFARASGSRWLVRVEDIDTPRVVPGAEREILLALERYGLTWDGDVVRQSERTALYESALDVLRKKELVFPCGCSRAEIARAASAPSDRDLADTEVPVYPGTCRGGLPPGRAARAIRFRVPPGVVAWDDGVFGRCEEETSRAVGDIVVRRADGPFAYQLAVVVDDAAQGISQVVRGADLLSSTGRQILLQRALGHRTPSYAHLPLVLAGDGTKLGKRDGALPLETLDERRVAETLARALAILGQSPAEGNVTEMLEEAVRTFRPERVPREPARR